VKYKILIVDDEESGRKTLQILLPKLFWAYIENISLAKDYKSASEKLIKEKFGLILQNKIHYLDSICCKSVNCQYEKDPDIHTGSAIDLSGPILHPPILPPAEFYYMG
jgi:hypothetical protein